MIEKIEWDSNFLKRKIGKLKHIPSDEISLKELLLTAKNNGFFYINCRLDASELQKAQLLERCGFYISDVGVTWKINLLNRDISIQQDVNPVRKPKQGFFSNGVKMATSYDVVELRNMAKGLFYGSRFYNDPFYSETEADALYAAWVENSIKGITADAVFFIKKSGFVACKQTDKNNGIIPLIGVIPAERKSGIGHMLIKKALEWFRAQGVLTVRVRTQAYNIAAMNFYKKLQFSIESSDITMAIILKKEDALMDYQ